MILVDLDGVTVRQPERALFEDLSLTVSAGDRIGVVGRNGGGKSTLLRVVVGVADPDQGEVRRGRGVRVGHLDQRPELPSGRVGDAIGHHWEAAAILDRLGMSGLVEASVGDLSGGEAKRLALARVLVAEVDLLVLDEPTNHLDIGAITWLEDRLASFRGGLVMVTHDRHVLDRVTSRILELDRGQAHVHQGGYQSYLAARLERAEREESAEAVRRNLARAELEWLRRGARARTRKPKARVASAREIVQRRAPSPDRPQPLEVAAPARGRSTPRLGDKVLVGEGLGHRRGQSPWLFRSLDLDLAPGGRLGVVGANGAGKSTLLDILAGRLEPAEGTLEAGVTARIGYYDQTGSDLDPTARVRDVVAGSAAQPGWEQVRLMERFWFDGNAQWARVATLSGGEQRRLQLLVVLAGLPNVLLMDEPTNDLDLDTLRALEDFLDDWTGSLVVVTHDRAHLARTVEQVLLLDGQGGWTWSDDPAAYPVETTPRPPPSSTSSLAAAGEAGSAPAGRDQPRAGRARSPGTIRRLMAQAERDVAEAESDRERIHTAMAVCNDHQALVGLAQDLAHVGERLAEAEGRWLTLVEELGG